VIAEALPNREGKVIGVQVDNAYISVGHIAAVLSRVPGVSDLRKRRLFSRSNGTHIKFNFHGVPFLVHEPFADNSRYWIVAEDPKEIHEVLPLLDALRRYKPSWLAMAAGQLISGHCSN
jgi:hypothetical protein